jgi:DNA-binding MarR family transcriptional regulator
MENRELNQKEEASNNDIELIKSIPAFAKIEEKDIISSLFSLYKTLLPEEIFILQYLYNNGPSNIKKIRREYAFRILFELDKDQSGREILQSLNIDIRNVEKLQDERFEKVISTINKSYKKKIPSYYTFKKILEDLERLGLVAKRELKERRAETIYFLSPKFSKLCSKAIRYLDTAEDISFIEAEVFKFITGIDTKLLYIAKYAQKETKRIEEMRKNLGY